MSSDLSSLTFVGFLWNLEEIPSGILSLWQAHSSSTFLLAWFLSCILVGGNFQECIGFWLRTHCQWKKKFFKNGFCVCLFFPATQEAIKHNSFLCPEKKLEQGNIEEAFEKVDQIVEGKRLRIFDRILQDSILKQILRTYDFLSESPASKWQFSKFLLYLFFLNCVCVCTHVGACKTLGGGR